jgi:hypothetical protein
MFLASRDDSDGEALRAEFLGDGDGDSGPESEDDEGLWHDRSGAEGQ